MINRSEQDMITLGKQIAEGLVAPCLIELIGDVGAGKTTLTKGIAEGLGVEEPLTSPSFTISKTYLSKNNKTVLTHFDFYRLADPGIMAEDLAESISDENTITVIEWGETVAEILPKQRIQIFIRQKDNGDREVEIKK